MSSGVPENGARSILPLELAGLGYAPDGQPLIDAITATLHAGPRTVILGPNGAGKSLLLRLCHGLIEPTTGSVRWRGPDAGMARQRQAMVFQRPVMLRRSVAGNIAFALKLSGHSRDQRHLRTSQMLAQTGLLDLARQPARLLSGGEQQRLALARAWALGPEVLFLDEPTASLDPAASRAIEELIQSIHGAGTKIIMTTHDLGQAHRLADEVLFLYRGRLFEIGAAERFFMGPVTREATAFLKGELTW